MVMFVSLNELYVYLVIKDDLINKLLKFERNANIIHIQFNFKCLKQYLNITPRLKLNILKERLCLEE